ncbi:uncharacterized protein [Argopecten irradians]|uniref:uncharacterized protein n=1 Tax=Argopecten irradians TaxID=31199 RepID=UPI003719FC95
MQLSNNTLANNEPGPDDSPLERTWLHADEVYTCGICVERGWEDDEDHGILWVGCDNEGCGRWFHRTCLPTEEHASVDLSLLTEGTWHCHTCSNTQQSISDSHHITNILDEEDVTLNPFTEDLICQVCMCGSSSVCQNDRTLFWATCCCNKIYHQYCLPKTVLRHRLDMWTVFIVFNPYLNNDEI